VIEVYDTNVYHSSVEKTLTLREKNGTESIIRSQSIASAQNGCRRDDVGRCKGTGALSSCQDSLRWRGRDGRGKARHGVSIAAGANLFDTAAFYSGGASERRLGELALGKDALIASKFPSKLSFRAEELRAELEASLARLERTSIDLYQHHFPNQRVSIPKLMELLADAVEAGKVKAVGVSNYSDEQMREAYAALAKRGIALASNQVEYSLLHRQPEGNGVLDACRELGVTLIAYSPLAGGALTGKYSATQRATGLRRFLPNFSKKAMDALQPVLNLLREIGERYSKTPSQVAIRWLIENPIVLPIPGAKNSKQATQNAGALSFSLTPDEVAALSQATIAWRK
jgi:aryl-alcohol dehydrogenase-like predicted oxidoreductase